MTGLRFTALQSRPLEFLDFTSLTLAEFQQLVPPFEAAFRTRMAAWRMDGKPRTARRFTVYQNCPLLTPKRLRVFRIANTVRLGRGSRPRAVVAYGAVRKLRGTLRQHVG
jgi:hypothetical protein